MIVDLLNGVLAGVAQYNVDPVYQEPKVPNNLA